MASIPKFQTASTGRMSTDFAAAAFGMASPAHLSELSAATVNRLPKVQPSFGFCRTRVLRLTGCEFYQQHPKMHPEAKRLGS